MFRSPYRLRARASCRWAKMVTRRGQAMGRLWCNFGCSRQSTVHHTTPVEDPFRIEIELEENTRHSAPENRRTPSDVRNHMPYTCTRMYAGALSWKRPTVILCYSYMNNECRHPAPHQICTILVSVRSKVYLLQTGLHIATLSCYSLLISSAMSDPIPVLGRHILSWVVKARGNCGAGSYGVLL